MNCKRCGSPLPNKGAICKFCGAMMDQEQLEIQNAMKDKSDLYKAELKSDRYGIEKNHKYNTDTPKENKALGLIIILIVVVFLIFLAILLNR